MTSAFAPRLLEPRPRVDLVFFDAGGGHRATATALEAVLAKERPGWAVHKVNLRDVLDPIDVLRRITRVRAEDLYNHILKHDLTAGIGALLPVLHLLVRRTHRQQVRMLRAFWQASRPDLVVSLIPHFNRALLEGLRDATARARQSVPLVTILTDLADYPPNFWIERQDQYFVCGTAKARSQALELGHAADHVFQTSGMIVRPEFYAPLEISRELGRSRLGLRPHFPTGLVLFGGFGSHRMLTVARRLAEARPGTQLIFICGRNRRLREQLTAMRLPFPHHIEGYTPDVPYFMRLADYFIGKPGPGSLSEAMVAGLPVIVERNARTMVQERYNAEWIVENGVGLVLGSFARIASGIEAMIDPERLAGFRARVAGIQNRAVFEVVTVLDGLMGRASRPAPVVRRSRPFPWQEPTRISARWSAGSTAFRAS